MKTKGFTLIEVVLVVAVFLILISSASSVVMNKTSKEDLNAKAKEVVNIINRAHDYAVSGYMGDEWGIKVLDSDSDCQDSGDCIVLFRGNSYSGRANKGYDESVELTTGVYIEPDQENEFYFNKVSGWLSTSEQGILLKSNYGVEKTVTTTEVGLVYYGD